MKKVKKGKRRAPRLKRRLKPKSPSKAWMRSNPQPGRSKEEATLSPNGPDWPNPPWSTFLLRKLIENNHFKNTFINYTFDFHFILQPIDGF